MGGARAACPNAQWLGRDFGKENGRIQGACVSSSMLREWCVVVTCCHMCHHDDLLF